MPKSKREKKVSLTQTKKKGLEAKQNLVQKVRECVEEYDRIFIFSVCNMRNNKLKEVRAAWRHSRFFYGKNKVMAIALGRTPETEIKDGLHKVSANLVNEVGMLFTSKSRKDVIEWFENYSEHDFARAGNLATSTVELDEGPLVQFSHSIEPHLRKLGLPVSLKKGVVTMLHNYTVCKEGDILSPQQTSILKLLNVVMAQFSIDLRCVWDKKTCEFELLETKPKEQNFNMVRVTSDDQEYDYVENEGMDAKDQEEDTSPASSDADETEMQTTDPVPKTKFPIPLLKLDKNANVEKHLSPVKDKVASVGKEEVTSDKTVSKEVLMTPRRSQRLRNLIK